MTKEVLVCAGLEGFGSRREALTQSQDEIQEMDQDGWGFRIKKIKKLYFIEWYKKAGRLSKNGSVIPKENRVQNSNQEIEEFAIK